MSARHPWMLSSYPWIVYRYPWIFTDIRGSYLAICAFLQVSVDMVKSWFTVVRKMPESNATPRFRIHAMFAIFLAKKFNQVFISNCFTMGYISNNHEFRLIRIQFEHVLFLITKRTFLKNNTRLSKIPAMKDVWMCVSSANSCDVDSSPSIFKNSERSVK